MNISYELIVNISYNSYVFFFGDLKDVKLVPILDRQYRLLSYITVLENEDIVSNCIIYRHSW